jgi:hypothetical protein
MPDPATDRIDAGDVIREARRPIIVDRHRPLVTDMESSLGESWITGVTDHPRLAAMLAELELDSERARIRGTLATLSDARYRDATVRQALVEELCLLRDRAGIEVAALQMHAIGVYRMVRQALAAAQGDAPALAELREFPCSRLGPIATPRAAHFGDPSLDQAVVCSPAYAERTLATFRRLRRNDDADTHWDDAEGLPTLSREAEEPLLSLAPDEQRAARLLLQRDRVRSHFYRKVFLDYLSPEQLDPAEAAAHPHVLAWLVAMESTGHLYPFLQGQTTGQKSYRIGQLAQKIVQMHEVYARIRRAETAGGYAERFAGLPSRDRLLLLVADRYPAIADTRELALAALLCPFPRFVAFIQERTAAKDFVMPPDPRR